MTTNKASPFSSIEDAIEDVKQGKMIVIVDDEDRENEGLSKRKLLKNNSFYE